MTSRFLLLRDIFRRSGRFLPLVLLVAAPISLFVVLARKRVLIRFGEIPSRIGPMSSDLDTYLTLRMVGVGEQKRALDIFCGPPSKPPFNKSLFILLAKDLIVVPRLFVIPFLIIINEINSMKRHRAFLNPEGNFEGQLNDLIHRYDSPLLLPEDAVVRFLSELPDDFRKSSDKVVLALRDSTYTEKIIGVDSNYSVLRNMDENQIEMIVNTLTFNGCKVIRGGSVSKPLAKIQNVNFYDYSNSSLRNDFNDLALFATSKFCIGADTGLHNLALLMRKPTYLLSTPSFTNKLTSPLVKLVAYCDFVDTKTNNPLSLYEMKERGVFTTTGNSDLFEVGVTVRRMDEKSIFEFIGEVLKYERGEWEPSSYSIELKWKFLEYLEPHGFKMDSTFNFPNYWARNSKWLD